VYAIEISLRRRRRRLRLRARGLSRLRRRLRCDVLLIVSAAVVRGSRIARRPVQCATGTWTDGMARRQRIVGPRVPKTGGGGHTCWNRAAMDQNTTIKNRKWTGVVALRLWYLWTCADRIKKMSCLILNYTISSNRIEYISTGARWGDR